MLDFNIVSGPQARAIYPGLHGLMPTGKDNVFCATIMAPRVGADVDALPGLAARENPNSGDDLATHWPSINGVSSEDIDHSGRDIGDACSARAEDHI